MKDKRGYLDTSVGFLLKQVSHAMHTQFERRLSEYGVTASQWVVLSIVKEGRATSPVEISKLIQIDNTAVTRLIDRLEKKGLVERANHPDDRRSVTVKLSVEGEQLYSKLVECSKATNKEFLRGVSKEEHAVLLSLLQRLAQNISCVESKQSQLKENSDAE